MEIRELSLFSNNIDKQEEFYKNVLGFHCLRKSDNLLEIRTKENKLIFEKTNKKLFYHFAFLIPTRSLESAISFMEEKHITLLQCEGKSIIRWSDTFSGSSFYFYDKDENIVEFVERPILNYQSSSDFSIDSIIKLNEIGLSVLNPKKMAEELMTKYGITPSNKNRINNQFCWTGDYNGVIIVVKKGRNWFPTERPGITNDFTIKYFDSGKEYKLKFEDSKIIQ